MKERKILIAAILVVTVFCVSTLPTVQNWWKKDAKVTVEAGEGGVAAQADKIDISKGSGLNYDIHKDRSKELGTEENPFIVLEIVPFEGYAEIGYLIGGCEPIDFEKIKYIDIKGDLATIIGNNGNIGIYCEEVVEYHDFYSEENTVTWEEKCYGYFQKTTPGTGEYKVVGDISNRSLSFDYCGTGGDYTWVLKEQEPLTVYDGYGSGAWTDVRYIKSGEEKTKQILISYDLSTAEKIYAQNVCAHVIAYYYKNQNYFLKNSLGIPESDIPNYHIQVVTITPEKLNANLSLIDAADWFVISCKAHVDEIPRLWGEYYNETLFTGNRVKEAAAKTITKTSETFEENDISWEAAVAILKKVSPPDDSFENYAPLVIDVGCYDDALSWNDAKYTKTINSIRKFSDGMANTFSGKKGSVNNIYKLYLMTQIFNVQESGYFYKNYIESGLITTKVDEGIENVKRVTTGCYQPLVDRYGETGEDEAIYWNKYTFMDIENSQEKDAQGKVLFFDEESGYSHFSVRNGVFIYNGDNPMSQTWGNVYIDVSQGWKDKEKVDIYQSEPFTIPEFENQETLTPEEIIYYLLHRNTFSVEVLINGSDKNKMYSNVDYDEQNKNDALLGEVITKEDGQLYGRVHFNIDLNSKRPVESKQIQIDIYQEGRTEEKKETITEAFNVKGEKVPIKLNEDCYYDVPLKLLSVKSTEYLKFTVTIWYRYKNSVTDETDPDADYIEKVLYEYKVSENGSVVDNRRTLTFVRRAMFDLE